VLASCHSVLTHPGCRVLSFSLPYLSVPPTLATFKPSGPAADSSAGSSADAMTHVMSQIVAQIAAGQVVS